LRHATNELILSMPGAPAMPSMPAAPSMSGALSMPGAAASPPAEQNRSLWTDRLSARLQECWDRHSRPALL